MTQPDSDEDQRRYARYQNHNLAISVARPGITGLFKSNPSAGCLDFSLSGFQIESDQALSLGDRLLVDIELDDLQLRELASEVTSVHDAGTGRWCYGAKFCFDHPRMKKDQVFHHLLMFEERLRGDSDPDQTAV